MEEFDCDYTDEPVCPYCGFKQRNFWEHMVDDGEVECQECEKSFIYRREIMAIYCTKKAGE